MRPYDVAGFVNPENRIENEVFLNLEAEKQCGRAFRRDAHISIFSCRGPDAFGAGVAKIRGNRPNLRVWQWSEISMIRSRCYTNVVGRVTKGPQQRGRHLLHYFGAFPTKFVALKLINRRCCCGAMAVLPSCWAYHGLSDISTNRRQVVRPSARFTCEAMAPSTTYHGITDLRHTCRASAARPLRRSNYRGGKPYNTAFPFRHVTSLVMYHIHPLSKFVKTNRMLTPGVPPQDVLPWSSALICATLGLASISLARNTDRRPSAGAKMFAILEPTNVLRKHTRIPFIFRYRVHTSATSRSTYHQRERWHDGRTLQQEHVSPPPLYKCSHYRGNTSKVTPLGVIPRYLRCLFRVIR